MKPLTQYEKTKIRLIAEELAKECRRSGKPATLHRLPAFKGIRSRGGKIRLSRAFSGMAKAGEIDGIMSTGSRDGNHMLYDVPDGSVPRGADQPDGAETGRKSFWQRLLGG